MVKFKTFRNNVLEEYRNVLIAKNFNLVKILSYGELWHGNINIRNKENIEVSNEVCILFTNKFPYEYPEVYALSDEKFIKSSRHQNGRFLCLWNEGEWDTYMSPNNFYQRIENWFEHSFNNNWENKDRKADLDRHFHSNHILAINDEEWQDFDFNSAYGYYKYTKLKFKDYIQGVYIYNPQNGTTNNGLYVTPSNEFIPCNNKMLKEFHYFEQNNQNVYNGIWFYCKEEIKPCETFEELKKQIFSLCELSIEIINDEFMKLFQTNNDNIMLSIIYKDCDDISQWIHFDYNKKEDILATFKTCKCDKNSLSLRISHLKTKLQDKKIAIFGIGAIGSFVASSLGRHGFNEIKLIDYDLLEPQNIIRHSLSACFVGIKKAYAMSQMINNFSLGSTSAKSFSEYRYEISDYEDMIKDVDIVVDCTANKNFSLLLNHICIKNNKLAIYITSLKKASIGKIIVVRPKIDPCLCCYQGHNGIIDNYKTFDYPYIYQDNDDEINLGCGDTTYPAVSSDIEMIAVWGVKIILWVLQNKFNHNFCLIVNDIQDKEDVNPIFNTIGHTFKTFKKMEGCEICAK